MPSPSRIFACPILIYFPEEGRTRVRGQGVRGQGGSVQCGACAVWERGTRAFKPPRAWQLTPPARSLGSSRRRRRLARAAGRVGGAQLARQPAARPHVGRVALALSRRGPRGAVFILVGAPRPLGLLHVCCAGSAGGRVLLWCAPRPRRALQPPPPRLGSSPSPVPFPPAPAPRPPSPAPILKPCTWIHLVALHFSWGGVGGWVARHIGCRGGREAFIFTAAGWAGGRPWAQRCSPTRDPPARRERTPLSVGQLAWRLSGSGSPLGVRL
jgi:hypothetical protein